MHEDLLERRLRAALRDEARGVPFTITAAELERRRARRGHSGTRRLTLLVAAAVAIGALGVAGLLAGLGVPRESTSPATVVLSATPAPTQGGLPGDQTLPSLDQLIAQAPADVLVASAHGPADGPGATSLFGDERDQVSVTAYLGTIQGGGDYRITGACFGPAPIVAAILPADVPGQTIDGPQLACTSGAIVEQTVHLEGPAEVFLQYHAPTSWRVAVSAPFAPAPIPTADPILPALESAGVDELVRIDDGRVGSANPAWGASGLLVATVGEISARRFYAMRIWCETGAAVRVVFGAEAGDPPVADTETHITCDGQVHVIQYDLRRSSGTRVAVAARPGARWSLVVESAS